jgi:hypothetical protein
LEHNEFVISLVNNINDKAVSTPSFNDANYQVGGALFLLPLIGMSRPRTRRTIQIFHLKLEKLGVGNCDVKIPPLATWCLWQGRWMGTPSPTRTNINDKMTTERCEFLLSNCHTRTATPLEKTRRQGQKEEEEEPFELEAGGNVVW